MSVDVSKQLWILSSNIDVENPNSQLATGAYTVAANTWYNLTLSVVGTTVNAWVDTNQVGCVVIVRYESKKLCFFTVAFIPLVLHSCLQSGIISIFTILMFS